MIRNRSDLKAARDALRGLSPEERASIPSGPPKPPDETEKVGPGHDGPLNERFGQRELQRSLRFVFIVASKFLRSEATFSDAEFEEEAKGILDLINRFPILRVILRLLGPIASISGFWEKIQRVIEQRKPQEPKAAGPNVVRFPWQRKQPPAEQNGQVG